RGDGRGRVERRRHGSAPAYQHWGFRGADCGPVTSARCSEALQRHRPELRAEGPVVDDEEETVGPLERPVHRRGARALREVREEIGTGGGPIGPPQLDPGDAIARREEERGAESTDAPRVTVPGPRPDVA